MSGSFESPYTSTSYGGLINLCSNESMSLVFSSTNKDWNVCVPIPNHIGSNIGSVLTESDFLQKIGHMI